MTGSFRILVPWEPVLREIAETSALQTADTEARAQPQSDAPVRAPPPQSAQVSRVGRRAVGRRLEARGGARWGGEEDRGQGPPGEGTERLVPFSRRPSLAAACLPGPGPRGPPPARFLRFLGVGTGAGKGPPPAHNVSSSGRSRSEDLHCPLCPAHERGVASRRRRGDGKTPPAPAEGRGCVIRSTPAHSGLLLRSGLRGPRKAGSLAATPPSPAPERSEPASPEVCALAR